MGKLSISLIAIQALSCLIFVVPALSQSEVSEPCSCPVPGKNCIIPLPDCTKFLACSGGQGREVDCPSPMFYSVARGECDDPDNVPECVGGTRPPPTTTTTTTEPTTTEDPGPTLTTCGSTAEANRGRIEYKLGETYDKEELCSFVIRTTDFGSIVFKLEQHGINGTWDPNAINIFTFNQQGLMDAAHLGPPNPLPEVYVHGGLAVVVFRTVTKAGLGTGFELSFEGVGPKDYGNKGVARTFSEPGNVSIPNWPNYGGTNNIIILSQGHKRVQGGFKALRMMIVEESFDSLGDSSTCGHDSLRIFSFTTEGSITEKGLFCNIEVHRTVYDTTGLLIMMFRKWDENYWYVGTGGLQWGIVDK